MAIIWQQVRIIIERPTSDFFVLAIWSSRALFSMMTPVGAVKMKFLGLAMGNHELTGIQV